MPARDDRDGRGGAVIRAVALDFDGVLVETVEVKTEAFAQLFRHEGPEIVQQVVEYHQRHGGVSRFEKFRTISRSILRRPLSEEAFQRLCQEFASLVVTQVISAPWADGAEEFLRNHHERYRLVVISGTPEEELRAIVHARGAERWFSALLGSPRTKPVLLQGVLARYRLAPTELVFVGDSATDWQAAVGVGVPFILRWAQDEPPTWMDGISERITSLRDLEAVLVRFDHHEGARGGSG